jgi:hypothetical protein
MAGMISEVSEVVEMVVRVVPEMLFVESDK